MNPKLKKVIADIEKMEARLAETQATLKDLRAEKKTLEDMEIVKAIRSMKPGDVDVMELLRQMQEDRTQSSVFSASQEDETAVGKIDLNESEEK